jgi:PAS domain S-box-containing protein
MRPRHDWKEMREGIIGLGEESSRRSYYPELVQRLEQLEEAQAGLRRSEENLRTLFDAMHDAIMVHDMDGRAFEVNEATLALYGVSREEALSFTLLDFSEPTDPPGALAARVAAKLEQVERVGHVVFPWRAWRPKRREGFDVEVALTRVRWYGQDAMVAVIRDTTERTRLETRLHETQRLEALGQLAGGVAHDTNNMLGVILGYAELLLEEAPEDSRLRADLEQIRKASLSSAGLIRQLLAFARKQPIQPVVADLNILVGHTLQMLRRLVGEQYRMLWQPTQDLWLTRVDPNQLDQVLTNLCLNARDAIQPGQSITIETANVEVDETYARFHPDAQPGSYVALVVSDVGCGMAPELQARIFEPFFTTKEIGHGTGLGLAMVYGIMRQNDGFISVYSSPGSGSTFRLHFPRHLEAAGEERADAGTEVPVGSESVLLVEDEEALLGLGSRLLAAAGYRVIATADPLEALRFALDPALAIDLLATDLVMPGLSGRELHEQVRILRPGIRTLFLSGYSAGTLLPEHLGEPGLGFLQKPFTRAELLRKVREVLDA